MKSLLKTSVVTAAVLGASSLLVAFMNARAATVTPSLVVQTPASAATAAMTVTPTPVPARMVAVQVSKPAPINPVSVLDARRQFALGMIETGNNDREVGSLGEVSRYQIMPILWRQFSDSRRYHSPEVSLGVAQRLWTANYTQFKQQTRREPTDFDMYVLWNTRYGYYASKSFKPSRLNVTVRDRAQRFVNLVEKASAESTLLASR